MLTLVVIPLSICATSAETMSFICEYMSLETFHIKISKLQSGEVQFQFEGNMYRQIARDSQVCVYHFGISKCKLWTYFQNLGFSS